MKAAIFVLLWAFCFSNAQKLEDIPECARDCISCELRCVPLGSACSLKTEAGTGCVCGYAYRVKYELTVISCIHDNCDSGRVAVEDVMDAFTRFCDDRAAKIRSKLSTSSTSSSASSATEISSATDSQHETSTFKTSRRETESIPESSGSASNAVSSATASSNPESSAGDLSTGAKAGIGVGAALGGTIICGLLFFLVKRKMRTGSNPENKGSRMSELSAGAPSNRHELDSGIFKEKKEPVELGTPQMAFVAELDGDANYSQSRPRDTIGSVDSRLGGYTENGAQGGDDTARAELDTVSPMSSPSLLRNSQSVTNSPRPDSTQHPGSHNP